MKIKKVLKSLGTMGEFITQVPNDDNILKCHVLKSKRGNFIGTILFSYQELDFKLLKSLQKIHPEWDIKGLKLASEKEVYALTGFNPETLPVIALFDKIPVLTTYEILWIPIIICHAGRPNHWLKMPSKILLERVLAGVLLSTTELSEERMDRFRTVNHELAAKDAPYGPFTKYYQALDQTLDMTHETLDELLKMRGKNFIQLAQTITRRIRRVLEVMQADPEKNTWQYIEEELDAIVRRIEDRSEQYFKGQ